MALLGGEVLGGKIHETWEAEKEVAARLQEFELDLTKQWIHKYLMLGSHRKKISREIEVVIKIGMKCKDGGFDSYFGFHIQLLVECGSTQSLESW